MTSPQSWQRIADQETRLAVQEVAQALPATLPTAAFRAYSSSIITISTTSRTQLTMNTVEYDFEREYNPATGIFTPKYSGVYLITAGAAFNTSQAAASNLELLIYKNGTRVRFLHYNTTDSGFPQYNGADTFLVQAGDQYAVYIRVATNPTNLVASSDGTWFGATLLRQLP